MTATHTLYTHLSDEANAALLDMVAEGFTKRGAIEHLLNTRRIKKALVQCAHCGMYCEKTESTTIDHLPHCPICAAELQEGEDDE